MYRRPVLRALLPLLLALPAQAAHDPLPSFAPMLREAAPAVVNIATSPHGEDESDPATMQELLHRNLDEAPRAGRSLGSGFIISDDGEILTNQHVVAGADRIRVRLANDEEFDARVIGGDDRTDIALLRISAGRRLPVLRLGDSELLEVGDWVVAVGNPLGLSETATAGIVSAKGRFLGAGSYDDFIETDASITAGNSGGPLLDLDGRVVGINAALVSAIGGSSGIGFAVSIKLATWVVGQLREHGRVVRGSIGLSIQPVTADLAGSFGLAATEGALVADVAEDGPSGQAGIRRGDVITRFGDHPVKRARDLPMLVTATAPGSRVAIEFVRDGERASVEVAVGELSDEAPTADQPRPHEEDELVEWGLVVRVLGETELKQHGLKSGGLLVEEVEEASPAEEAGMEPGDIVVQANRQPVRTVADLKKALAARSQHALLLVQRGTASIYVELDR